MASPNTFSSGAVFVLSAPSGTGKSTVVRGVMKRMPGLSFSVSATTRKARKGERDGREYHFMSRKAFRGLVKRKGMLEWVKEMMEDEHHYISPGDLDLITICDSPKEVMKALKGLKPEITDIGIDLP